mmetsp:Transcript_22445/g.50570  ORF Transcript_22445/g.50570 Transcript_22445/m.50570 type:complete len:241 (-) Transcript_22445:93-815(-)
MPKVQLLFSPRGFPMQMAQSPVRKVSDDPSGIGDKRLPPAWILRAARSSTSSDSMTSALKREPSGNRTNTRSASCTTCALVNTVPALSITKPLPCAFTFSTLRPPPLGFCPKKKEKISASPMTSISTSLSFSIRTTEPPYFCTARLTKLSLTRRCPPPLLRKSVLATAPPFDVKPVPQFCTGIPRPAAGPVGSSSMEAPARAIDRERPTRACSRWAPYSEEATRFGCRLAGSQCRGTCPE